MRRRSLFKAAALLPFGARVASAAPPAELVTPAMIEAAKKEGSVTYYTAMDLSVAEPLAKAFEAKYPASRSRSSARARSGCSIASRRKPRARSTGSMS
jgi:hypothetical protein